ncbi:hypothetical protein KVR01_010357 [Diaporthe batatas]|uniref:uncharacterized protein n=1 Tax=Diaporthe batatas TaxID=748121 RepID=UPI001D03A846|nr:uncharacterized protein KVR01_010357 [Diaporthe batatas]KAG8159720.1 hypothetical protein KVR01_010357 [Diaporthe batatas]
MGALQSIFDPGTSTVIAVDARGTCNHNLDSLRPRTTFDHNSHHSIDDNGFDNSDLSDDDFETLENDPHISLNHNGHDNSHPGGRAHIRGARGHLDHDSHLAHNDDHHDNSDPCHRDHDSCLADDNYGYHNPYLRYHGLCVVRNQYGLPPGQFDFGIAAFAILMILCGLAVIYFFMWLFVGLLRSRDVPVRRIIPEECYDQGGSISYGKS